MADDDESGNPPPDPGAAGRSPADMLDTFDLLLGDNLAGRKQHIEQNGHLVSRYAGSSADDSHTMTADYDSQHGGHAIEQESR